ncbi:hypothetical protein D0Z00_003678 [Geotrichum galactomycetum]|uniref:Uncharacterized protein n=1 Tax=Geotrichum galactomycetum TaxID=27317 RepID=A0ACB6V0L7_9ASCO|nr:hypothetical protein D0Z00_003678 [Geotrichum candidum]
MFKRNTIQLCKLAAVKGATRRSFASAASAPSTARASYLLAGAAALAGSSAAYYYHHVAQTQSGLIQAESSAPSAKTALAKTVVTTTDEGVRLVQPETTCPPFPAQLDLPQDKYQLLGVGVRTVSFLSFHVYALGIYIAERDRQLAHDVLAEAKVLDPEHEGSLESALLDHDQSTKIISHLLDHDISLDLRIVPVRNTDFSHLRDGFVRQILAHPLFKQLSRLEDEAVGESLGAGVNDLKVAFSRKLKAPKSTILHMTRLKTGELAMSYYQGKNEKDAEVLELGIVKDKNLSKILMLQYLAGKNVSSESARVNAVEGLAKL